MFNKKALALSRNWLLTISNINSNKLALHPLVYWAQSPEVWHDCTNYNNQKNLLVYVLRFSNLDNTKFELVLDSAKQTYNLFFLSICLDNYTHYNKQSIITALQHSIQKLDRLGPFLNKNDSATFYQSLDTQDYLQTLFCDEIKHLPDYDQVSASLCSVL